MSYNIGVPVSCVASYERSGVLATCVRRVIFKGVSIECEAQSKTSIKGQF